MNMPPPPPPMPPMSNQHSMEANMGESSRVSHSFVIFMNVVNTLTQLMLGGVVICAFCAANILSENSRGTSVAYEQHIYLNTIGYVILMSQAVLTLQPHAGWASTLKYPQKKGIHWILQVVGATFAIAGSTIKIIDTPDPFQTPHGIMGCVALVLTVLSLLGGLFHLMCSKPTSTVFFKTCHGILGSTTITIAFITLCLGFTHPIYRVDLNLGDKNANLSIFTTVAALLGILVCSFTKIVKRIMD